MVLFLFGFLLRFIQLLIDLIKMSYLFLLYAYPALKNAFDQPGEHTLSCLIHLPITIILYYYKNYLSQISTINLIQNYLNYQLFIKGYSFLNFSLFSNFTSTFIFSCFCFYSNYSLLSPKYIMHAQRAAQTLNNVLQPKNQHPLTKFLNQLDSIEYFPINYAYTSFIISLSSLLLIGVFKLTYQQLQSLQKFNISKKVSLGTESTQMSYSSSKPSACSPLMYSLTSANLAGTAIFYPSIMTLIVQ